MATVNKDFKIKSGLIVEGTTATVNGFDILTKKPADDQYIIDLIGGETLVKSVSDEFNVSVAGELSLDLTTVDGYYDPAGSAANAQVAAQEFATAADLALHGMLTSDIAEAKAEAGVIAEGYADSAESDAIAAAAADATSKANAAQAAAEVTAAADATSKVSAEAALRVSGDAASVATAAADATSKANAAQAAAEATASADATSKATTAKSEAISVASADATSKAGQALVDAKAYTDAEVAALVDGAPALLDTLNELAAAIADNPNYATDVANLVAGKADTTYVDGEITALDLAAQEYAADALSDANAYTDVAEGREQTNRNNAIANAISDLNLAATYDAIGSAATAQENAENYADSLAVNYDAAGAAAAAQSAAAIDATTKANAAEAAAIAHADALDTDDIEEGASNLYFTDYRAKASAMDLLLGADKTNLTIEYNVTATGLVITAENGVADSTTDDLAEGEDNLYFTDVRAVDALQAVVPNFTAVEINSVAKQVAATLSAPTAGIQTAHAFAKADFRSAEYLVKVAYGTHTEISKVLLTLDASDNIAITEYGIVGTNGSASSISAGISGTDVQLLVTTTNNNSTVTVMGTLLK